MSRARSIEEATRGDGRDPSAGLRARLGVDLRHDPRGDGPRGFRLSADLSIAPGETVALLGPNGAGKSTAVSTLAGLRALDEGHITLAGRVLDDPSQSRFVPSEQRRVGVVFQDPLLFPHLSVLQNVAFGLRSRRVERHRAHRRARAWLDRLELQGLEDRRPDRLSGGQAQRVALARALVTEPDLLLLDEPLSALDVSTRGVLRRTLATHLADFPGPRLLITHDPTEAFLLADVVHVLEQGRVTQVGSPDEIRLRPRTPYAADLAGANLLRGRAAAGRVDVGDHGLHVGDHAVSGPVLVTIRPTAITVHRVRPEGSQRNTWSTTIERVEPLGDRVRLRTAAPLPLTAEVTRESSTDLELAPGREVWLAVKATEIGIQPER